MICLQLELMEQRWATTREGAASAFQLDRYQRAANTLRRLLASLGLQRRSKDVTPTVDEFLASEGYRRGEVEAAE